MGGLQNRGLPREIIKIATLPEGDKLIAVFQIGRRGAGKVDQPLLDTEKLSNSAGMLLRWLAIVSEAPGTWGKTWGRHTPGYFSSGEAAAMWRRNCWCSMASVGRDSKRCALGGW